MKKSVGIITTHYAANYGAILQAYALQNIIQSLGYDCEIIDFRPNIDVYGRKYIFRELNLKIIFHNIQRIFHFKYLSRFKSRIAKMDEFLNEKIKKSDKIYKSYEEIIEDLPQYDCYVCGSDQVWNTRLMYSPAFFLRFEKKNPSAMYVAFAPSFPEVKTQQDEDIILNNIKHFDYLSAREHDGAEFLAQKTKRCVENVLDPVFLLPQQHWSNLGNQSKYGLKKEKYLLLYFIGISETIKSVVKILSQRLNIKVIYICLGYKDEIGADEVLWNASPADFVGLIKNATFVCTNSFHATAFSIIFSKGFCTVGNNVRNSRMINILEKMGMEERLLTSDNEESINRILGLIKVEEKNDYFLQLNVQKSENYLKQALEGVKKDVNIT